MGNLGSISIEKSKTFPEPIAIVGMGLRSSLANTVSDYWRKLSQGESAIGPLPPSRFNIQELMEATPFVAPGFRWSGGFLPSIDCWDPEFFGVPLREAVFVDPQQRLLLEVAWEALEDSGVPPSALAGESVGVFVGCLYG